MSCSTAPYRPIVFIDEAIPGYDYVWLKFRLQYASSGTITIFVNDVEVLKTDNLEATVTGLNPGSTYKIYGKLAGDSTGIVKNVTLKTASDTLPPTLTSVEVTSNHVSVKVYDKPAGIETVTFYAQNDLELHSWNLNFDVKTRLWEATIDLHKGSWKWQLVAVDRCGNTTEATGTIVVN